MAAAVSSILKWNELWVQDTWVFLIFGSTHLRKSVCYFFPKMELPKPWSFCSSSLMEEESSPLSDTRFEKPSYFEKPKRLGKNLSVFSKPTQTSECSGSYIQCMNKCYSPILIHYENILQINTMTTSKMLCFCVISGHLIQDGMNMPLVLFCFIFSSFKITILKKCRLS